NLMTSKQSLEPEIQILLTGLAMGESPRWRDGHIWFSDWGAQEIAAVDVNGNAEVVVRVPFGFPFYIDWLPWVHAGHGLDTHNRAPGRAAVAIEVRPA